MKGNINGGKHKRIINVNKKKRRHVKWEEAKQWRIEKWEWTKRERIGMEDWENEQETRKGPNSNMWSKLKKMKVRTMKTNDNTKKK